MNPGAGAETSGSKIRLKKVEKHHCNTTMLHNL